MQHKIKIPTPMISQQSPQHPATFKRPFQHIVPPTVPKSNSEIRKPHAMNYQFVKQTIRTYKCPEFLEKFSPNDTNYALSGNKNPQKTVLKNGREQDVTSRTAINEFNNLTCPSTSTLQSRGAQIRFRRYKDLNAVDAKRQIEPKQVYSVHSFKRTISNPCTLGNSQHILQQMDKYYDKQSEFLKATSKQDQLGVKEFKFRKQLSREQSQRQNRVGWKDVSCGIDKVYEPSFSQVDKRDEVCYSFHKQSARGWYK